MKLYTIDANGNEVVRNETRQEILARHAEMAKRHAESMELLDSLHVGKHFEKIAEENARADREELEHNADLGLVTLENNKTSCDDATEIMERVAALLSRHRFGYKGGIHRTEDRNGYRKQLKEAAGVEVEELELVEA